MNSNYIRAKQEADEIDELIINTLKEGKSFKVEAGAGTGKTYSLMKVIDWIQENEKDKYITSGKKVACITYTNAAVNVILSRLDDNNFITPNTIHAFAWENIKRFQKYMINIIYEKNLYSVEEENPEEQTIKKVEYTLGVKYLDEDGTLYLHHNDVITILAEMLENKKFRRLLSQKYPLILIDEYQDSNKLLIDKFKEHFIDGTKEIQFGFFGDAWQTIYKNLSAVGEINSDNIVTIEKKSNFRCYPAIVGCLNNIRPDLPQISAMEGEGTIKVIHCNDFEGIRRDDKNFKGELPTDVLRERILEVQKKCLLNKEEKETLKTLMITHKVLSVQQNYDNLLEIMGDGFKEETDPLIEFVINVIEPLIILLEKNDTTKLFEILKSKRTPIKNKSEKRKWLELKNKLETEKNKTILDVLDCIVESKLIPIPDKINETYMKMKNNPEEEYRESTYGNLSTISYKEFENGVEFLQPNSYFSTEHGVKGEEYDNVIFIIGRGWNQYAFEKYMPMYNNVTESNKESYEKNRNLFYVCCSRAIKNLVILVTIKLEGEFLEYIKNIFGEENIYSFCEFIEEEKI